MNETNIFEQASREKLRFTYGGVISVEDLWDLGLEDLDGIYRSLSARLQSENEESLLRKKSEFSEKLELQIAVVKHVFQSIQAEQNAEKRSAENRIEKQKLLEVLAEKQNASLTELSEEELRQKIESLG